MSHAQQIDAAKLMAKAFNFNSDCSVLEIGSYDVNGTVRAIFASDDYVGVDLISGPTVDKVISGHEINFNRKFDFVISFECFEHNPHWELTLKKMIESVNHNGYIFITCASKGRIEHGTARTNPSHSPGTSSIGWNYYKNLEEKDFTKLLKDNSKVSDYLIYTQKNTYDLYVICSIGNLIDENLCQELTEGFKLIESNELTLFNILNQLWYLPTRILFKILGDTPIYQLLTTKYFKYTKGIFSKIFSKNESRK